MSHIPSDWVIQPAPVTCCDRSFEGLELFTSAVRFTPHHGIWLIHINWEVNPRPAETHPGMRGLVGGLSGWRGTWKWRHRGDSKKKVYWDKTSLSSLITKAAHRQDPDQSEWWPWTCQYAITRPKSNKKFPRFEEEVLDGSQWHHIILIASPTGMQLWLMTF